LAATQQAMVVAAQQEQHDRRGLHRPHPLMDAQTVHGHHLPIDECQVEGLSLEMVQGLLPAWA
jgi:hypothetical protein